MVEILTDEIITLKTGETAVVGFGLLLSRRTVDRTLGHDYAGPFVRCLLDGWRRSWDVSMPNAAFYYEDVGGVRVYPEAILYLNARRDPATLMNCVVFVLKPDELAAMNDREWISHGVVVTRDLRGVRVEGGDALMYVGKVEHEVGPERSPRRAAVRSTYLRMLDGVLNSLDPEVCADYFATTDPVPEHLVIDDTLDLNRPNPWEAAGYDFDPDSQGDPGD